VRAAIAAEIVRLRTVRAFWLTLAAAEFVVVAGTSGLANSADSLDGKLPTAAAHVGLASICTLVLGILAVAGEYRHRTISDSFLSFPRRTPLLIAKLVVTGGAAMLIGVAASATELVVARAWWQIKGVDFGLTAAVWQTLAGGIAWNVAFAAIGVALGALVRNLMGAVALALAWVALVETIVGQLLGSEAARWLPFAAGQALGKVDTIDSPLAQPAAAAVLAGYVLLASVAAGLATLGRDVT
jgi:ABC-2 type transport system permease protein